MEQALREGEARYRLLAENASDIIWTVNMNMQLTYISPSVTRLLGSTVEEAKSRTMEEAFTPASFETAMRAFAEEMALETARPGDPDRSRMLELELTCKDGVVAPVEVNFSFLRDATGKPVGILSIARDITERKRAEEALYTEKQRFQTLSEQAPFGMVMIHQDGTFKYINPKFRELFGYELTDVPDGKTWFRKAYPDPTYRHHVIGTWIKDLEVFKPGEKRPELFTVTCKDGTEKIINFMTVQLATGETLIACENITERKHAEKALQTSEEQARQLAQENAQSWLRLGELSVQP